MAELGMTFNVEDAPPADEFDEIPVGEYEAEITDSKVTETKDGQGLMAVYEWTVINGDYTGRKLWQNVLFHHTGMTAQGKPKDGMGKRMQADIVLACGLGNISNTEQLHGTPCLITVGMGKPSKDGQYPARAEVKKVSAFGGAPAPAATVRAQSAPVGRPAPAPSTPRPPQAGGRPWPTR